LNTEGSKSRMRCCPVVNYDEAGEIAKPAIAKLDF
jgi:hypothetical protein